jgi:hypothetical protein
LPRIEVKKMLNKSLFTLTLLAVNMPVLRAQGGAGNTQQTRAQQVQSTSR